MRHVISAVQIVVDENLPVAVQSIGTALEEIDGSEIEWSDTRDQTAEEFPKRSSLGIEIDKDKLLPGLHPN